MNDMNLVATDQRWPAQMMDHKVLLSTYLSKLWRCWLGGRKGIRPAKKLNGGMLAWLYLWVKVQICM